MMAWCVENVNIRFNDVKERVIIIVWKRERRRRRRKRLHNERQRREVWLDSCLQLRNQKESIITIPSWFACRSNGLDSILFPRGWILEFTKNIESEAAPTAKQREWPFSEATESETMAPTFPLNTIFYENSTL